MFISIHIPKTAGTTLGYLLDFGSNRRIMYFYDKSYANVGDEDSEHWLENKPFMEKHFDVIHGHFFYQKFANVFPNAHYITCLRHPVDRIVSQWFHATLQGHNYIADAALRGATIVDWAKNSASLTHSLSLHLNGRELRDYDFLFLTENFAQCWRLFETKFAFQRNDQHIGGVMPHLNDGRLRGNIPELPKSQLLEIYNLCAEDVELYKQGVEIVTARLKNVTS